MRACAWVWCVLATGVQCSASDTTYLSYGDIVARLYRLQAAAPHLVSVWTAQDRFGLPSPGACADADGRNEPCRHVFAVVSDTSDAHAANSSTYVPYNERPHVFISGNLHGDEVVGPMATIHLLEGMIAERVNGTSSTVREWLTYLLRRRIFITIPISNPLGYVPRLPANAILLAASCCVCADARCHACCAPVRRSASPACTYVRTLRCMQVLSTGAWRKWVGPEP